MREEEKGLKSTVAALAIVFLTFGGYFAFASFWSGQNFTSPFVANIQAKDGEDDGDDDSNDDEDEDEDEDENDDRDGKDDDDEDKQDEAAKKASERAREAAKKAAERLKEDQSEDDDSSDDELEGEDDADENEGRGDENAMYKDRNKTLSKLNEKLTEAEKEILEKQAEGVDVTAALARLALAKAKVAATGGAFDGNDLEAAKTLAKEAQKLTHFAKERDLHDAKEVTDDIADVAKRIAKVKSKIAALAQLGGDVSTFNQSLSDVEADFAAAKNLIAAGGDSLITGLSQLESIERRAKVLKNTVESALFAMGATDDDEFENEHEDEVEDATHEIEDLAEIEDDSTNRAIKTLAQVHATESKKITEDVRELHNRNAVAAALLGVDDSKVFELNAELESNVIRIMTLEALANEITDVDIKNLILAQVDALKSENAKIQSFVTAEAQNNGLFGWFFRLF